MIKSVIDTKFAPVRSAERIYLFTVSERMNVSESLRDKIIALVAKKEAASNADKDEFGRVEIYENQDFLLVSENWDSFTNDEKAELNKVLEGK